MGGYESGPQDGRYVVEDCLDLDISVWTRKTDFNCISSGTLNWSRNGQKTASIDYEINHGRIRLLYTWREAERVEFWVELTHTRPFFGGKRRWFACPGLDCGRRVGKLYLAPGSKYFLCRHCQDLRYTSQRESDYERMITKAQNIRRKLGGSTALIDPFPEKPKGMHWRKYYDLRNRALTYQYQGMSKAVEHLG